MDMVNASLLEGLLIACAVAAAAWICLLIYRGTLEAREDDQIFIDAAEDALAREQRQLVAKIEKLSPIIRTLLILWIVLLLASGALWVWQGFRSSGM